MNSLYRGKALEIVSEDSNPDLDWVYGNLVEELCSGRCFIADVDHINCIDGEAKVSDIMIEVDPETLGQYTGKADKNGKKIFEGDILEGHYDFMGPEETEIVTVVWDGFGWSMQYSDTNKDKLDYIALQYNKVIGNIHDTPELGEGRNSNA